MMMKNIMVEILVAHTTVFNECMDCNHMWHDQPEVNANHLQNILKHLASDRSRDLQKVALWAEELLNKYGGSVHLRVVDAFSMEGVVKSAQYGVGSYPAVVINRSSVYKADTLDAATHEVAEILGIHPAEPA